MNNFMRPVTLAGLLTISAGLAPQFSTAQSASPVVDFNSQNTNSQNTASLY